MQILEIGEAIYVIEQIAYVSKDIHSYTNKALLELVLTGNSTVFTISFDSVEERDESYKALRKIIIDYKKEKS